MIILFEKGRKFVTSLSKVRHLLETTPTRIILSKHQVIMSSDEGKIREEIYDEIYASKRSPLAAEIIREAAKQFAGIQKAWLQRVFDTNNYDHVMTTFEEVLDEVVETFIWIEVDKIQQKKASRPANLTLSAVATMKTVSSKEKGQQSNTAGLSKS